MMATMTAAPMTVPTRRKLALRIDAPRLGWHTSAAEVAAQNGFSICSQNASSSDTQTDAQSLSP